MSVESRWRIEYKKCKCFGDGYGGRLYHEVVNGKNVRCCLGATNEPTEWADICEECFECPKYIKNVLKGAENDNK